jgi:hypothetical protein
MVIVRLKSRRSLGQLGGLPAASQRLLGDTGQLLDRRGLRDHLAFQHLVPRVPHLQGPGEALCRRTGPAEPQELPDSAGTAEPPRGPLDIEQAAR